MFHELLHDFSSSLLVYYGSFGSQKSKRKLHTECRSWLSSFARRPNSRRKMLSYGCQLGSVKAASLELSVLWEELCHVSG
jgi:hypothetical protein